MYRPKSLPQPTAVLWDMDGTLIDQTPAILRCYEDVISGMGYEKPDSKTIQRSLGGPMASTMALFVEPERMDAACRAFRARFPEIMFDGMIVLGGGIELIEQFAQKDIPQALFTNKHGDTARAVSEYAGFAQTIPVCIGSGDTTWHKPDPELTRFVLEQIKQSSDGAVMIGDSPTDVAVAQNAGLRCYGVSTGAHTIDELLEAGAKAAFESLHALRDAIDFQK